MLSLRIIGFSRLGVGHFPRAGARLLSQQGMGRQAVLAPVDISNQYGNLFPEFGTQTAFCQRAKRDPRAFKRRWRFANHLEHVGDNAKGVLDLVEQCLMATGYAIRSC